MNSLFAPATALMSKLKFSQRFSVITILFLLPLSIALFMLLSRLNADVQSSQRELQGTTYLRSTHQLLRHVITDWLLSQTAMRGLHVNDEALAQNAANIDADMSALAELDARLGGPLRVTDEMEVVRKGWEAMSALPQNINRQILYSPFVRNIEALMKAVGDGSSLVLDSQLDTHYTMQAVLNDLPQTQITLADMTMLGEDVIGSRNLTEDQKAVLNAYITQLIGLYDTMQRDASVAYANNPMGNLEPNVASSLTEASMAVSGMVDRLIVDVLSAPLITLPTDRWLTQADTALQATYRQWDAHITQLDTLLAARISSTEGGRSLALGLTAAVLLLVVYMWIGFYLAVMKTAAGIERASAMLTGRGSAAGIILDSNDELSRRVASSLNQMASATQGMASMIDERTNELTEVSTLLAYMNDGVVITEADGTIKILNPAAVKMLGVGFGDAVGKPLSTFILDPRFQTTMETALTAPRQRYLVDIALNNRIVSVSAVFAPVTQDKYEGMLILEDVTELRTLQHLQQSRSTAALGNR